MRRSGCRWRDCFGSWADLGLPLDSLPWFGVEKSARGWLIALNLMRCDSRAIPLTAAASARRSIASKTTFGLVSRVTPVQTALRNCTRDEGGPFEFGNQVLISSHRKLLWSKAMVVSVAEKAGHDPVRQG
jgi:hypothetical protein